MTILDLTKIVYDPDIYPREKWSTKTIESYTDSLVAGDKFPPIILEENTNRILDGVHRWKAYQAYNELQNGNGHIEQVEVEFYTIPDGIPPKLYAASFSVLHGDRISPGERRTIAREVYEENPNFTLETLKSYLHVSMGSAHNYVADILARRKEEQKMIAFRLHLLGWTQEEIGQVTGLHQTNIGKILREFSDLKIRLKKMLDDGHPHLDISERYNMPLILVWAIDLESRTDAERFERLGIGNPQPYDVWNFQKCHDLFGSQYPGRIPGQLIAHVIYFFTQPGAMIIDPMIGSGTTLDVCLAFGRKCYAYDINQNRMDVIKHNLNDGWHDRLKKADLIFWDPPYFDKKDKEYIDGSISQLPRDKYLSFFKDRLTEAKEAVKKGCNLAFLMSDWDDDKNEREGIFIWDYANLITEAGWKLIRHIQVPLSTQQVHPDIVIKFRKSRRLARLERYLLVAESR